MRRVLYSPDHELFRQSVTAFFDAEATPHLQDWERAGRIDRDFFRLAGALGIMGLQVPEEYGGNGLEPFTYNTVVSEAAATAHFSAVAIRVHAGT